jgi:hypothetical protein
MLERAEARNLDGAGDSGGFGAGTDGGLFAASSSDAQCEVGPDARPDSSQHRAQGEGCNCVGTAEATKWRTPAAEI